MNINLSLFNNIGPAVIYTGDLSFLMLKPLVEKEKKIEK